MTTIEINGKNYTCSYGRTLLGFPDIIVEEMLKQQEIFGKGKKDIKVFENYRSAGRGSGGFSWSDSKQGHDFRSCVIDNKEFHRFFELYPEKAEEVKENKDTIIQNYDCF